MVGFLRQDGSVNTMKLQLYRTKQSYPFFPSLGSVVPGVVEVLSIISTSSLTNQRLLSCVMANTILALSELGSDQPSYLDFLSSLVHPTEHLSSKGYITALLSDTDLEKKKRCCKCNLSGIPFLLLQKSVG